MYKSPVEIIYREIETTVTDKVVHYAQNIGINIDAPELIKALQYDRDQYDKGYADGYAAAKREAEEAAE